jgi:DNA-binding protein H-NS
MNLPTSLKNNKITFKVNDSSQSKESSKSYSDDLTIEELKRQREELDRKLAEKHKEEKQSVINQIVTVVRDYGVTIEELVDALGGKMPKRKGTKARIKYHDPETGMSWSGRGKEPIWLRYKDRDQFFIPEDKQSKD